MNDDNNKTVECDCDDWKYSMPCIISGIQFQYIYGREYKGQIFKYCPWCGKLLKEVE